jgi:hypothetical protein
LFFALWPSFSWSFGWPDQTFRLEGELPIAFLVERQFDRNLVGFFELRDQ